MRFLQKTNHGIRKPISIKSRYSKESNTSANSAESQAKLKARKIRSRDPNKAVQEETTSAVDRTKSTETEVTLVSSTSTLNSEKGLIKTESSSKEDENIDDTYGEFEVKQRNKNELETKVENSTKAREVMNKDKDKND